MFNSLRCAGTRRRDRHLRVCTCVDSEELKNGPSLCLDGEPTLQFVRQSREVCGRAKGTVSPLNRRIPSSVDILAWRSCAVSRFSVLLWSSCTFNVAKQNNPETPNRGQRRHKAEPSTSPQSEPRKTACKQNVFTARLMCMFRCCGCPWFRQCLQNHLATWTL